MTNPNRTPAGVPTGGQFAASARDEASVALEELDVYDSPGECVAIEAHLTSVDEDGYCNHCGSDDPDPVGDRHGVSDAYPNGRCTACGSGVDEAGHCYQSECARFDDSSPHAGQDTGVATSFPESAIVNDKHRASCLAFAATYADAPTDPTARVTGPVMTVPAADLAIGDRFASGEVISHIEKAPGAVAVFVDGDMANPRHLRDDTPSNVYAARVDWTDPDWFEHEVHRIVDETGTSEADLRERLTRLSQPRNISSLAANMTNAVNGRAKVGDNIVASDPMHSDIAYEVIGKMHCREIVGADENGVQWAESREVDYVLKNLENGAQSTSPLTGPGYRRISAPEPTR